MSRLVRVLLVAVLLLHPMLYLGMYAGDAEIHLVYGANAAAGRFFEFNHGETSPGVTSPGFMLMVAVLFRYLPAAVVPVAVTVVNFLAWYGLSLMVFLCARRLGLAGAWAWVAAFVAGVIPGSVFNATGGMENGLFAVSVLAWVHVAVGTGWFDVAPVKPGGRMFWQEAVFGGALGLLVWLRPEGFALGVLALMHRGFRSLRAGTTWLMTARRSCAFLVPFMLVTSLVVAFHYGYTGYFLPSSGRARMTIGSMDAFWIGFFPINTKVFLRFAAYFPLTLMWIAGIWVTRNRRTGTDSVSVATGFLVLLVSVFFMLYSTVLGAAHLARYLMFVMPPFVIIAIMGARWLWERRGLPAVVPGLRSGRRAVLVLATILGLVFALETRARFASGLHDELSRVMRAPAERGNISEALYAEMGSPTELPIAVGYREVQARYWLDDRFVVCALDGRTDPLALRFVTRGRFDHVAYIKARGIRFLAELPVPDPNRGDWSLADLRALAPLGRHVQEGLAFTRLSGSQVIRVDPAR